MCECRQRLCGKTPAASTGGAASRSSTSTIEWIGTGEWVEVRSPYSGAVVGRVARAGADETRRAIDAAERAMLAPLPAHKRAEILVRVAGLLGRRHDEVARKISDEAGEPVKAAPREGPPGMFPDKFP